MDTSLALRSPNPLYEGSVWMVSSIEHATQRIGSIANNAFINVRDFALYLRELVLGRGYAPLRMVVVTARLAFAAPLHSFSRVIQLNVEAEMLAPAPPENWRPHEYVVGNFTGEYLSIRVSSRISVAARDFPF